MNEQEKRLKIKEIRDNSNLTDEQKRFEIQRLMTGNYSLINEQNEQNDFNRTCKHVKKRCYKLYFECCNTYDACVTCHFSNRQCKKIHPKCSRLTCTECETEQDFTDESSKCINCGITFALNFCKICSCWNDGKMYHCDKCGCLLCNKEEVFHCDECEKCLMIKPGGTHTKHIKCNKEKCSCCNDTITSFEKTRHIKLNCGHNLHMDCFNEMKNKHNYRCPICRKSMWDMEKEWKIIRTTIRNNPLSYRIVPIYPNDVLNSPYGRFRVMTKKEVGNNTFWEGVFEDWNMSHGNRARGIINENELKKITTKNIYCNDCNNKCITPFHFDGLECKICGSFNTQV